MTTIKGSTLAEASRRQDEVLATLAGELRNRLAPIRNALHLIRLDRTAGNATIGMAPLHEMLERQIDHLVRLADDLMVVPRLTPDRIELRRELVDYASVVDAAVESAKRLPSDVKAEDASAPLLRRRILVVDDNRDGADSLAELLRCHGADVVVAYDGNRALEALTTFRPSVALVDIGMPEMDGYELARRARALDGALIIIALTGWGEEQDRRRSKEAGMDHHLIKPVDFPFLVSLLTSLGG